MDNSGTAGTNTTNQTSPFAPADIPDLNHIAAQGAMPPMSAGPTPVNAQPMSASVRQVSSNADKLQSGVPGRAMVSSDTLQIPGQPSAQTAVMPASARQTATMVPGTAAATKSDSNVTMGVGAQGISMADIPEPKMSAEGTTERPELQKVPVAVKTEPAKSASATTPRAEASVRSADKVAKSVDRATKTTGGVMSSNAASSVTIEPLLEECIRQNASDLHLEVGLPPVLRVDGALRPMTTYPVLNNETVKRLVFSTLDEDQQKILMKDKEFDYSFAFGDLGRFRVNAFHEKGNMAGAFRLIPNRIPSIEELGLPGVIATFAERPNGLVLVTGPTGSGKSTTLAALVDKINAERAVHIITIEDPIEFTHQSKRAMVAQREVHYDTYSFAAALRSILREDPDVVLIGEMRDLETIQAAITVAETGHLVFATLHTNSAAQSIDRMVDVFPAHQQPQVRAQLANILVGICSQRLIPAIDGGRVAVAEIMVVNSAVRAIIREGKTHQLDMAIQTGAELGMQTMDRELAKYVKNGIISYDVAREYAVDTAEFDRLVRG